MTVLNFPSVSPPPDRGRLLTAQEIAKGLLRGERSPAWVLKHVPGKRKLGHRTVLWWEYDVRDWIERRAS